MRQKIDYGIDLGTTNSAISVMTRGVPRIVKSELGETDTTPSCVAFRKNKSTVVGQQARNARDLAMVEAFRRRTPSDYGSYVEFKRTMGTDVPYSSALMQRSYTSEELSAEVLKALRNYARDEQIDAAVITVPAKFRQNQIDATQRAAELAGFKYCELLQEPIAASLAYGVEVGPTAGRWLVFDFGGGTFDAALMHVQDGIMKVLDTDGDNRLGGKDLDAALVDSLLIPALARAYQLQRTLNNPDQKRLFQNALNPTAEQLKIRMSNNDGASHFLEDFAADDTGTDIEFDLKMSLQDYERVCMPTFQRAVDITLSLLDRNKVRGNELSLLLLVGGPTRSETLRRMLREQVTPNVRSDIDPMTAVACGAALFASTRDMPRGMQKRDTSRAQLTLSYPATTVELRETLGLRVDRRESSLSLPAELFAQVVRCDRGWSTPRVPLDGDAEIIEVDLMAGKPNQFEVRLSSRDGTAIACQPDSITITQGMKVASPPLSYAIGLDVYDSATGHTGVYALKGLEKNSPLPASGSGTFQTTKQLRPGNKADQLTIRFYEMHHDGEGSRAIHNQPMGTISVSGEDVSQFLPVDSSIKVTVRFDESRRTSYEIYIPATDEIIERKGERDVQQTESASSLKAAIDEARTLIERLRDADANGPALDAAAGQVSSVDHLMHERGDDADATVDARERLRRVFIELERLEADSKWPPAEEELTQTEERLDELQERYGSEQTARTVAEYHRRCADAKSQRNTKIARELNEEMRGVIVQLLRQDIGFWIAFLKEIDENFDKTRWTDRKRARQLLEDAKEMLQNHPNRQRCEDAVRALWQLMPEDAKPTDIPQGPIADIRR